MEKTKKHHGGGSAFIWGLVIGALLATLLTTKGGRKILREFINAILDFAEDFGDKHKAKPASPPVVSEMEEVKEAADDLGSQITEIETEEVSFEEEQVADVPKARVQNMAEKEIPKTPNISSKKRMFHGIHKK